VVSDSDWISEYIIFTFWIWFEYGVHEKVSDWIRIAQFPYPCTPDTNAVSNRGGHASEMSTDKDWIGLDQD